MVLVIDYVKHRSERVGIHTVEKLMRLFINAASFFIIEKTAYRIHSDIQVKQHRHSAVNDPDAPAADILRIQQIQKFKCLLIILDLVPVIRREDDKVFQIHIIYLLAGLDLIDDLIRDAERLLGVTVRKQFLPELLMKIALRLVSFTKQPKPQKQVRERKRQH